MPQNFLIKVIISNGQCLSLQRKDVMLGATMTTELQAKAEKYEGKAAQCREWAEKAKEGPQRILHEVLADYYVGLATDFRNVIAKKQQMPA